MRPAFLTVTACTLVAACGSGNSTTSPVTPADTGFTISGNAESSAGATWTFKGIVNGVTYDLAGVLFKPAGTGPFPAVVLSHGHDGTAAFFASLVAPTMVQWGLVCIATNYTHSVGVPIGAPGDTTEQGASQANVLRAHMTHELLRRLAYVDMARVAAHGHSMGAYVTVATAGAYPTDFRVASTTGGGVRQSNIVSGPAPSITQALGIRTPFQMHHGDVDATVPISLDVRFDSLLTATGIEHQFFQYPGEGHEQVRTDPAMFTRVHAWYTAHGIFP